MKHCLRNYHHYIFNLRKLPVNNHHQLKSSSDPRALPDIGWSMQPRMTKDIVLNALLMVMW